MLSAQQQRFCLDLDMLIYYMFSINSRYGVCWFIGTCDFLLYYDSFDILFSGWMCSAEVYNLIMNLALSLNTDYFTTVIFRFMQE